ncbi:RNA polymerase sporulation sigma factor SigK [Acidilutibacter cellobiosedens]|uniref:RNA polymerase sigma factor n=1 Tax=Acidilutibacter cellobiosedens TaxID=2507161 RepID=A0A410QDB3_9FIRM|nr:RNA polymerase sporulation sigma factor SigK [Acidilutibacter cellobiosedens]MBE6081849.1 RNA polymerase sporulation sigma factor SigK [Tissierellaceae bacterium]QAT62032.1 RNA polymerase sporulation sigma factor SigK [Acidilutibacter cellobiosedens]
MEALVILELLGLIKPFFIFVGYISSANSFPKPLTNEEEEKYLELFAEGNEEARNILIERNLRLVAHIVKKYANTGKDSDDLISIGTIGLIKAITTFNRDKGTRLATYAAKCIDNEILMTIRSNKKVKVEVSLQEPIGIDKEGNEISLMDILGTDVDDIIDQVDLKLQVKKLYSKINKVLKDREKVIVELRYGLVDGECKTQREIADMLGISRSYVSRIEKRAIKKLNKSLNGDGCY